jgi:hypothetical protein
MMRDEEVIYGVLHVRAGGDWVQATPWDLTRRLVKAREQRDDLAATLRRVREFLDEIDGGEE